MISLRFLPLALVASALAMVWGCKDDTSPPQQVTIDSELKAGSAGTQKCRYGPPATFVSVSKEGVTKDGAASFDPAPVPSGENGVSVNCRVAADGDGFQVDAQVQATGVNGGTVSIKGRFTPSGPQAGIRAVFQKGDVGSFEQNDCTASYEQGTTQGVAAGRVWAKLDCPKMVFSAQERECAGSAEFRFENCAQ